MMLFQFRCLWAIPPLLAIGLPGSIAQAQDTQQTLELPEVVVETPRPKPVAPAPTQPKPDLASTNNRFNELRDNLSPHFSSSSFSVDRAAINALPQGTEAPIDKVLLQAPGISQDSAASGEIHVRNEHANVQYRINGMHRRYSDQKRQNARSGWEYRFLRRQLQHSDAKH